VGTAHRNNVSFWWAVPTLRRRQREPDAVAVAGDQYAKELTMADDKLTAKEPVENGQRLEQTRSGFYYRPNVDILERTDDLVVLADMPGSSPESIDIHFEDGELTIHAKVEPREPQANYLLREYGVGDFYRAFRVSENVDASKIAAEYTDGVLRLTLPKAEAAKPRKINVKA
jgi:HSP20 family protein